MTCYVHMPLITPNFVALSQTMYKKSVTKILCTFSILASQEDPLSQSSPILATLYTKARSINVPNFVNL